MRFGVDVNVVQIAAPPGTLGELGVKDHVTPALLVALWLVDNVSTNSRIGWRAGGWSVVVMYANSERTAAVCSVVFLVHSVDGDDVGNERRD